MKKIKLTQNKYTLVSERDFAVLSASKWYYDSSNGYAVRNSPTSKIYMHRFLLNTPKGAVTDHINGNRLDNRRANLRSATHSQNHANQGLQRNNASGFKGVSKHGSGWRARMKLNGKGKHLGTFANKPAAARAYNDAAQLLFGDFALLNKV